MPIKLSFPIQFYIENKCKQNSSSNFIPSIDLQVITKISKFEHDDIKNLKNVIEKPTLLSSILTLYKEHKNATQSGQVWHSDILKFIYT